jgi:uncharacterized membrane protein
MPSRYSLAPLSAALVFAAILAAACSSSPAQGGGAAAASTCTNVTPKACAGKAPVYQTDIAPIVQSRCFPCHTTGGEAGPTRLLNSYQHLKGQQFNVNYLVGTCQMPPADHPQPTDDERAKLLNWIVCGTPE